MPDRPPEAALAELARSEWRTERLRRVIWVGALVGLGLLYAGWVLAAVRYWTPGPKITVLYGPASYLWKVLANPGHWSLLCMALVPGLAGAAVLLAASLAVPAARQSGSLEPLRLAPFEAGDLARALLRPRLRTGLLILAAGLPFYFVPHQFSVTGEFFEPWFMAHTLLPSTLGRALLLASPLGASDWPGSVEAEGFAPMACNLYSGTLALLIDASRLFALAAISTAVSLRARTAARAVFWSAGFSGLFLLVTAAAEALGALFVRADMEYHTLACCAGLAAAAIVFEVGFGNLLVPWLILRAAVHRAEGWLARAEED